MNPGCPRVEPRGYGDAWLPGNFGSMGSLLIEIKLGRPLRSLYV